MNEITITLPKSASFQAPTNPGSLLIPSILFTPIIIFFMYFLVKAIKERQKMYAFLTLMFATTGIANLLNVISSILPSPATGQVTFIAAQLLDLISMLALLLVFQLFDKDRLLNWQLVAFISLVTMISGTMLSDPNIIHSVEGGLHVYFFEHRTLGGVLLLVFSIASITWLVYNFIKMRREATSKKQKSIVKWLMIGIVFSQVLGAFAPVTFNLAPGWLEMDRIIGNITLFKSIGMLIVGITFYKVGNTPWLLQRQHVQLLLVYSRSGIPMFSRIFDKAMTDSDVQLLTGAMTAITAIFNESTKVARAIETILFKERELRIIERPAFLCVLLEEYSTHASETAHENFVRDFERNYGMEVASFSGNQNAFDGASEIVNRYFA
ncbi:hypothetical protein GF325_05185 [Candidatus Bathyarchaeota archaeon]|nr:hypothetical protein [Candidatus Bathyarchaeota archaeon]